MVLKSDIVIIGAGPVGLFAIFECGMLGYRECHVIDALPMIGGQCSALYPEKPIYDIPAQPKISGQELIDQLTAQAAPFNPTYHLNQQVTQAMPTDEGGWRLTTSVGTMIQARAVILAAGVGAFGPNRPPLDGIEGYEGTSVFYSVQRAQDFAGKRIVIAGGGDSAVDWANALVDIAAKIYVVHRRPKFRAHDHSLAQMEGYVQAGKIELVTPYQLQGLQGDGRTLTGVTVAALDGQTQTLAADCLLPFFGLSTHLGPIAEWGLGVDHGTIPVDPATMGTNQPGFYAIGDICTYPGKLKLILTGFAEAAVAAYAIRAALNPGKVFHFEYSTTQGVG